MSSREVYPFRRIRYSFLKKKKKKKYIEHLFVRAVKNYAQGFVEYQFLSDVIRFKQTSYLLFLSFARSLKLFPFDSKGQVLFFSSVDFPWNLANWKHFGSDRSLQNAFVCPPSWIPKFTRPPFKPLTVWNFFLCYTSLVYFSLHEIDCFRYLRSLFLIWSFVFLSFVLASTGLHTTPFPPTGTSLSEGKLILLA